MGPGPQHPSAGGVWGARLNQTRVGRWRGAQTPVRCLPFPLVGPESDFPVEVRLADTRYSAAV